MKSWNSSGILVAAVFIAVTLFSGGCASKSGSTQNVNRADWEWVPSIWVVNSFGNQFSRCSYDEASTGYFCPPGTR